MCFAWNIDCGFSSLSRRTMSNLHFKANLIFTTLVCIMTSEPKSSEHHRLHVLLKGASNVAYISEASVRVICCIIWEVEKHVQVCFAAQVILHGELFLRVIYSVHIGDTDVLKSSVCCAHWPQSAASEGLWWGDKCLHQTSLILHRSHFPASHTHSK